MKKVVFENVSKSFGSLKILDNVSFELNSGDSMMILGRSGVGKSVTLKLLLGLLPLDSGDIRICGISVNDKSRRDEYRSMFSVLFQGCALFDSMTILENVMFRLTNTGVDVVKAKNIAQEKILSVGLSEKVFDLYPASISGGMQKRAALARAIAVNPEVILFDEPTSGLDPVTSRKISLLIKNLLSQINVTSLTITHDLNVAACFGTRAAMLDDAQFVWSGKMNDLFSSENEIIKDFVKAHRCAAD